MIEVVRHASLLHRIDATNPEWPDLQALIRQWHGQRIRRIDRYIQLCLAGGLSCAAGESLPKDTGTYLATRCGAVTTSARAIDTIIRQQRPPKPLHFVNTLGNSAGFYLTQLLGLTGNALVISQERWSFEAALMHAWLDIAAGRVEQALVGGFDEVPDPIEHQLKRLDAPADTAELYEGSHWLWLKRGREDQPALSQPAFLRGQTELAEWLAEHPDEPVQLAFTPSDEEQTLLSERQWRVFGGSALPHGVFSGAALVELAGSGQSGLHIGRSDSGDYVGVVVGRRTSEV